MRNKVLVTGACGFAGRYMCEYLRALEDRPEIIGTDIVDSQSGACDVFRRADLASSTDTADLIKFYQPDHVIHLAGTFGTNDVQGTYTVNVLSATGLLEAVLRFKSDATVIMAGSAAEYGAVGAEQQPVTEDTPCRPVTAYGLSKLLASQAALYYHRVHGLNVMIVRPFQLIGKGVTTRLAPGAFADQLRKAITSGSDTIKVGNLESSRDFLDITDAVRAIWMLCQKPAGGEIFNVCSGVPVSIGQLLSMMIDVAGAQVTPVTEQDYLRGKADVTMVYGSYRKMNEHCGWRPSVLLQESVRAMLE